MGGGNDVVTTVPAALRAAAADAGDVEAVVDGPTRWTYAQLDAQVTLFARAVIARGVEPGDRVAIWAPNSARWIVAALGVLAAGGVLVTVNTRHRGSEARYAVGKVGAVMLIVDDTFLGSGYVDMIRGEHGDLPTPARPIPALPTVRTVVLLDSDSAGDGACVGYQNFLDGAAQVAESQVDQRVAAIGPDDVSDILFTSGTTGYPKGAMVSHGSNMRVNAAWADMVQLRRGDRYLMINPFFHSFGYRVGIISSIIARATMLPMATFDVGSALSIIERERVTVLPGAPTVYTTLLDDPRHTERDLSSLRLAVTGATMVPVPLLQRMRRDLGFDVVLTAYGLTESCGTATICPPQTDEHRLSTSCGIAIPGTEIRIVDRSGVVQPPEADGEVQVRGHHVMVGYFEDPEATAAAIDADGWLHTGDLGWLDADGYLRITDRIKDVFMVGGFNVYPAEVERVIRELPGVADVAVVGVADERMGEVGHAFVELRDGADTTVADIRERCERELANYKRPRVIHQVDALPRTPTGKIQKFLLDPGS